MRRLKRGQSVLEYIIVLVAIILIIVAAAQGVIRTAVTGLMANTGRTITNASGRLP